MDDHTCLMNQCETDGETLEEAQRAYMERPAGRAIDICFLFFLVIAVAALILEHVFEFRSRITAQSVFLMVYSTAMLVWRQVFFPKRWAKTSLRRRQELYGVAQLTEKKYFLDNELMVRTEQIEEELHLSYAVFHRVIETKNLIVLFTKQRLMITLDKNGFQNGTAEDFWKLIAEKCPEAKLKRR